MGGHTWRESQRVAETAMRKVHAHILTNPEYAGWEYSDVSHWPDYQLVGCDFTLTKEGRQILCEVKGDNTDRTTLFWETVSNVRSGTPGCFEYTIAKWLYYHYVRREVDCLYRLDMEIARPWVEAHGRDFRPVTSSTEDDDGRCLYKTEGLSIPISRAMDDGVLQRLE